MAAAHAALFKGTVPPCKDPKNYRLSEEKVNVSFRALSETFTRQFKEIAIDVFVYDTKRKVLGSCLYIGFRKGMQGERCTIQGSRRNSHSELSACIPIPRLFSHVRRFVDSKWFEVVEYNVKKHAVLVPILAPTIVIEDEVVSNNNNAEVEPNADDVEADGDDDGGGCRGANSFEEVDEPTLATPANAPPGNNVANGTQDNVDPDTTTRGAADASATGDNAARTDTATPAGHNAVTSL